MEIKELIFSSGKLSCWLQDIAKYKIMADSGALRNSYVIINLPEDLSEQNVTPVHLVTLACLTILIRNCGIGKGLIKSPTGLTIYLSNILHLPDYFASNVAHVRSESTYDLNLWKITNQHYFLYSQHVADYIRNKYFNNKDLSGLKVVLDELYANISDHSKSNGIAYSYIKYDEENHNIRIAFCDFGIGIKNSLLDAGYMIKKDFIEYATRKGISAKTNSHNRGFGLDTVVSSLHDTNNTMKIVSGDELFISFGDKNYSRTWNLNFIFPGTLFYFDIPISSFEDMETVEFEF